MDPEKRRRSAAWLSFCAILALICILSFQDGTATRALDRPFVKYVAGEEEGDTYSERTGRIIYGIRQTGRAVLFLALGASWGWALGLSLGGWSGGVRLAGSCAVLGLICYVTEKAKVFIDGRHYAFLECAESFLFSMLGYLLLTLAAGRMARNRKAGGDVQSPCG